MSSANYEIDWLKKWAKYSPSAIALKDADSNQEYTYEQCYHLSMKGALYLQSTLGVKKGDRVAILSTNEADYVHLFFSLQRIGAIMVPLNFRLTARELDYILEDSGSSLLIYNSEFEGTAKELGISKKVTLASFSEALKNTKAEINTSTDFRMDFHEETPAMIIYTSGTTGFPKGAVITHKTIFWNSVNTTLRLNIDQSDVFVCFLPFFHTGGWNVLTTPFFHRGAKTVITKKFDADRILQISEDEGATLLFGVPTTMDLMRRSPIFEKVMLKKMRYAIVGGEPMPVELIKIWHDKGIPIRQGYGLTEFGPNVFSLDQEDAIRKIGSIGFPNFYIETKVIDDQGKELKAGEIGELCLKGPMAMKEYWNKPEATKKTLVDGWLMTGDLVKFDDEGYFYVVGRKKDMYISGAENVYPAEIEQVIQSIPGIREVAVIGVKDEKWGEVGHAFIAREKFESTEPSHEQVMEVCSKSLAKFKIPKYLTFLKELPKGDSGKILKRMLKDNL